jgi:hypothetical protein
MYGPDAATAHGGRAAALTSPGLLALKPVLDPLTTQARCCSPLQHMKAKLLVKRRIVLSTDQFAEVVIWQVPKAITGSTHGFKYRLAFVA